MNATRPPLRPLDQALAELLEHALPLAGTELVSTFDADGRVLAQDLVSVLQGFFHRSRRTSARRARKAAAGCL